MIQTHLPRFGRISYLAPDTPHIRSLKSFVDTFCQPDIQYLQDRQDTHIQISYLSAGDLSNLDGNDFFVANQDYPAPHFVRRLFRRMTQGNDPLRIQPGEPGYVFELLNPGNRSGLRKPILVQPTHNEGLLRPFLTLISLAVAKTHRFALPPDVFKALDRYTDNRLI